MRGSVPQKRLPGDELEAVHAWSSGFVLSRLGGLTVWEVGGLVVWWFGGLAVWWFGGGAVVWWFGGWGQLRMC